MYSGSSDGVGHDSLSASRKVPPASSISCVRNLRRFIRSGAGLGSESLMELEKKKILLDIFKEKQQRSAEAGIIPSFYKKKPEDGSISHRVQRLAKYRFLKKQSDLLLNADDLDAMWVCLRENCAIDDATGAEKKQSDLLLNADDLDAMWVCLRENCVIDDATGAAKLMMKSFLHTWN